MCDKKQGLSLITDPQDASKKVCAECSLKKNGCRLCKDDDITQCKMCEAGYSLETNSDNKKVCVKKCSKGYFAKEMTLSSSEAFDTMRDLKYSVCTACSGDCSECKGAATTCLLCTDSTKFTKLDGTCATSCSAGTFGAEGS